MKNKYEVRGDVTAIFINCKGNTYEALIENKDFERANKFPATWFGYKSRNTIYVVGKLQLGYKNRVQVRLHRWLFDDLDESIVIDHYNHNGLDNRRSSNLRKATIGQNNQNLKESGRVNNKSCGIRGVTKDEESGRWMVQVRLKTKLVYFGRFDKLEDAELAAKEARAVHLPYSIEAATIVVKDPSKYIDYRDKPMRTNKSGYKYIAWFKPSRRWRVEIKSLKITRTFEELEDAIIARDKLLQGQKVPPRPRRRGYKKTG